MTNNLKQTACYLIKHSTSAATLMIFMVSGLNLFADEPIEGNKQSAIYVSRDSKGNLVYSDTRQKDAEAITLSDSINVTKWEESKSITVVKAKAATKGNNSLSLKRKRCDKLEKLISRYRLKEKQEKNAYRYRALRRQHQWEKQQMSC
ncbi:MAG: hypothetical protein HWE27_12640 [Gammaproteobacteria bacterium]|nr:hypothetical protein [Gammaproteobacteria bacterium]